MLTRPSSDGPSDTPCEGCQRLELHKMCPAYGTPFYMSGVPYYEGFEKNYVLMSPEGQIEYFNIIKKTFEEIEKVRRNLLLDALTQQAQEMGLYDNPLGRK